VYRRKAVGNGPAQLLKQLRHALITPPGRLQEAPFSGLLGRRLAHQATLYTASERARRKALA
jgi:hypothetical protein